MDASNIIICALIALIAVQQYQHFRLLRRHAAMRKTLRRVVRERDSKRWGQHLATLLHSAKETDCGTASPVS